MTKIDSLLHGREAGNRRKITFDCDCVSATGFAEADPGRRCKVRQCGLASVYSTLSEETASGQDTSVNDRTAAHRSLPFWTPVRVENRENGRSAVIRIADRGPQVSGRIIDVSQIAAYELGFADLTKVCLKILSIAEIRPAKEK